MKVVWVTPALPHPEAAGGWAHEFELIAALAGRHEIEVLSSDHDSPLDHQALLDTGARFTRVPWLVRAHPRNRLLLAASVLRANPNVAVWLRRDRLRALGAALQALEGRFRPDIVHVTLGELAPLLDVAAAPTELLLFDSLTREIEARLELETTARRRAQLRLERRRTRRFESDWYRRATGLVSVSTVDAAWFEQLLGRPVEVIETAIPERFFGVGGQRSATVVTFVGTLNHRPNADAIEWLCEEIWPLVVADHPAAELRVVGRGDPEGLVTARIRTLVEQAGGLLEVDVPDVRPYYLEAAVAVAPIRLGGGMRTKVTQAIASRAPVVATPFALEGVPQDAAEHVLVASTPRTIADAIVATLEDPEAARRRADRAARGVATLASADIARRLEAFWARLLR